MNAAGDRPQPLWFQRGDEAQEQGEVPVGEPWSPSALSGGAGGAARASPLRSII